MKLLFRLLGARPLFKGGKSFKWGDTEKGAPWISWSNETDQCSHCGRYAHSIWKHGRAWFHWIDNCFGWEWSLGRWRLGVSLSVGAYGSEHELSGSVSVPGLSFYWHLDRLWPERYRARISEWWKGRLGYDDREVSVSVHNGALWWSFWCPENEWSSSTPRWRAGSFDPADFILGRVKCETLREDPIEGVIRLPEAAYAATATREHRTWKRPRWPFVRRASDWSFDIPRGLPIPGKGENSWDCGEDAIFGCGSSESDIDRAAEAVAARVLERRERYGGSRDWRPAAVRSVQGALQ